MAWPGITDFTEAVQNPQVCFRGTELESGSVRMTPRGMPMVYSGAFACVYPVTAGGRTFAVRCFTREVKDQQARYNQLSAYLLNVLPPSFVHFEYVEQGVNFRGGWYPIVKMEWVEGEVLSRFVEANLGAPDALRRVAAQWRGGPAASLRGLGIAHNDLQHGNVMVQADGAIRLVDYDGMFLPQFRGERSPELGHKNYQHPKRTPEAYGDYVDNFPVLVVYLSLLALAADPGLWDFHNQDNLIFTRDDYADPGQSALFRRLKGSPDAAVVILAERLEEYCARPVEETPDLETILRDVPQSAPPPAPAPQSVPQPAPGPASAPQPVPPGAAPQTYLQQLQGSRPAAGPAPAAGSGAPAAPAGAAAPQPAAPPPRTPTPSVQSAGQLLRSFVGPRAELKKVALGVLAVILAVTLLFAAGIAWLVAREGWYPEVSDAANAQELHAAAPDWLDG